MFSLKFQMVGELPNTVLEYALNPSILQIGEKIAADFGLAGEHTQEINGLFGSILMRETPVADLIKSLSAQFGFDETKARDCAVHIWRELCAPIAWYFENFAELMAQEKIDVSGVTPVLQPTTTIDAAVADILLLSPDMPGNTKEKLSTYVRTVLQGNDFDIEAVRKKISQSVSDGGFGINSKTAWKICVKLRDYLGEYLFTGPSVAAVITPATTPASEPVVPMAFGSELQPHEAAEVAALGGAAEAVASDSLVAQQQALVEAVLAAESLAGASAEVQARWKSIVDARVGGARDAAQTRTLILSPANKGGFDLPAGEAERLADLLEKTAAGFEQKRGEFSVTAKIASVMNATASLAEDPDKKQKDTQKELNARFVGMFGKDIVEKMRQESHREIETKEAAHPEENKTEMTSPAVKQHVAEGGAPLANEVASPPAATPAPPKYTPKIPDKLKNLIDADTPATAFLKKNEPAPAPATPKHSDIRAPQRLLGPIDELAFMTLIDWRRLSPDPAVRIQKIRSKIEVIGEDGGMEKIRAVQAFQQSEPAKIYREILRESLQKHENTETLIAEREGAHIPTLDTVEFEVVKAFLAEIRLA